MRPIYNITEKGDQKGAKIQNHSSAYSDEVKNVFFNGESAKTEEKNKSKTTGLNGIRDLINAFEGKSKTTNHITFKSRSKSHGNLSKIDSEENTKIKDLLKVFDREHTAKKRHNENKLKDVDMVKQQIVFLQAKIKDYKFSHCTYIEHQNEIVDLLIKIGEIEVDGFATVEKEKQKCTKLVKNCNDILTTKMKDYFEEIEEDKYVNGVYEDHQRIEDDRSGPRVSVLKSIFEDHHQYIPYEDYAKEKIELDYRNGIKEEIYQNDYNSDSTIKVENLDVEEQSYVEKQEKHEDVQEHHQQQQSEETKSKEIDDDEQEQYEDAGDEEADEFDNIYRNNYEN